MLEFFDTRYAIAFGRYLEPASSITSVDVVDVYENPRATIRADISDAPEVPDASFDTVICTQVLNYVFNAPAAVATLARLLRPGGVLYLTVPGISPRFDYRDDSMGAEYWRFTAASTRRLLLEHFEAQDIVVEAYGNVLAAIGFLHGLAAEEFRTSELDRRDEAFPVLIAARAIRTRPGDPSVERGIRAG